MTILIIFAILIIFSILLMKKLSTFQTIVSIVGLIITILSVGGAGGYFCGKFFAEVHAHNIERDIRDSCRQSLHTCKIVDTCITKDAIQFFDHGSKQYLGWLYKVTQGNIYHNLSVYNTTENGDSIQITENGENCKYALSMTANPRNSFENGIGWAQYELHKQCSNFSADIVIIKTWKQHPENTNRGQEKLLKEEGGIIFSVWGDDSLYERDSIVSYYKSKHISLKIDSVNHLRLTVQKIKFGNNSSANSCWANASVTVK